VSFQVVGIGEVLWDLLPDGPQMGGAPANFAYHAGALGAEARIVTRVGRDEAGSELIRRLERLGVRTDAVEVDPEAPTGTVAVEVAADGQPRYLIRENVAWDRLSGNGGGQMAVAAADAVCFGTLAQRSDVSRRAIRALLKATPAESLRIFDVNLRQHFFSRHLIEESLSLANIVKVNEPELLLLAEMFRLPGEERGQVAELARRFRLRLVAYTRGSRGSLLYGQGQWSEHPGVATAVADTVGAGDSFAAAMALGLLAGWSLDEVNFRAGEVAAYVSSQRGGMPELPERLRAPFLANRTRRSKKV
jgi:fructokinase